MTEDKLQIAVAKYLDTRGWLWLHVVNEGKRSGRYGQQLKNKGMKKGFPDVAIFEPWTEKDVTHTTEYGTVLHLGDIDRPGIVIELKAPRAPKKIPEHQVEWLDALSERGWVTAVCRTLQEVIDVCQVLT